MRIPRIRLTFFNWDIAAGLTARWNWTHFKIHHTEFSWHMVWGKLSILIENWTIECHTVCAECDSADIGEVSHGDEGWTVCRSCRSIEQGYRYVNLREYENAS